MSEMACTRGQVIFNISVYHNEIGINLKLNQQSGSALMTSTNSRIGNNTQQFCTEKGPASTGLDNGTNQYSCRTSITHMDTFDEEEFLYLW